MLCVTACLVGGQIGTCFIDFSAVTSIAKNRASFLRLRYARGLCSAGHRSKYLTSLTKNCSGEAGIFDWHLI